MAFKAKSRDGIDKDSEVVGELSAGEAKEEGLIVGDNLTDTFEGDGVVSETDYAGIGEGVGEVEELRHESGDLEGQDSADVSFIRFERRHLEKIRLRGSNGVEAVGHRSFDLDKQSFKGHEGFFKVQGGRWRSGHRLSLGWV